MINGKGPAPRFFFQVSKKPKERKEFVSETENDEGWSEEKERKLDELLKETGKYESKDYKPLAFETKCPHCGNVSHAPNVFLDRVIPCYKCHEKFVAHKRG
jgi:hypothetical protein